MLSPAETLPPAVENAPGPGTACDLGKLLGEHRGGGVTVLDLRGLSSWTDYFIIATVTSAAHLEGLERRVKEFSSERDLEILRASRRAGSGEEEWRLIDLGPLVVHLMTAPAREFYELERLWSAAPVIYRESSPPDPAGRAP
jgi:ribosome-associated protein